MGTKFTAPLAAPSAEDEALADLCGDCYADPLGWTLAAFPWGEPGTPLEHEEGPDANQREFLTSLGDEVRARGFNGRDAVMPILMSETSGHGTGKALAISMEIPTPTGTRRWGDLRIGDAVFAEDGTPTTVTGVCYQGFRQLFRVTFDDGSSVDADGEHLWKVRGRQERRTGRVSTWRTLTTAELLAAGVRRANGTARCRQWEIPTQGAAQFAPREMPVHPYTLGVWLGDGGRNSSRISSADPEVVAHLRAVGEIVTANQGSYSWAVAMLRPKLRGLGIADAYSYQKAVPSLYKENAIAVRAELLRGLLDTDGECDQQGSISFGSTSRALAEDVIWLVRSLGGKAKLRPTAQRPRYPGPDGALKDGRLCWRTTIQMPPGFRSFYVARKQARVRPIEARYRARWIDRIEPTRVEQAMCITIAHPSACYLANDFIVTHNSAMGGWLTSWLLSTRPDSKGTVTAGTATQLKTRTWAAIRYWMSLCLTARWFHIQASGIFSIRSPQNWYVTPQTCRKEQAQAFAGQHAKTSSSWYLFDEASEVPDTIWRTAYGGLTDGEPMFFAWGQPVRNTGEFHEVNFGKLMGRWNRRRVDARSSRFTNKALIDQWIHDYGIESDFVKVRVLGLPPTASELQYIDRGRVDAARVRVQPALPDDPLVAGLDVSGGGKAWNVFRFRKGFNGRVREPIRIPGEADPDFAKRVAICAELLREPAPERKLAALFVDAAFGARIVGRLEALGFTNVFAVNFGGESPESYQKNMRAYMYSKAKDWLMLGALPDEDGLADQLCGPGYHINERGELVLEPKESVLERMGGDACMDDADAFVLTFAAPVAVPAPSLPRRRPPARRRGWG